MDAQCPKTFPNTKISTPEMSNTEFQDKVRKWTPCALSHFLYYQQKKSFAENVRNWTACALRSPPKLEVCKWTLMTLRYP